MNVTGSDAGSRMKLSITVLKTGSETGTAYGLGGELILNGLRLLVPEVFKLNAAFKYVGCGVMEMHLVGECCAVGESEVKERGRSFH